ncbi:hypothetical protein HYX11_01235 [Candidatus Woesearchaeota archaeon]|nr:hypothetical protein [Candidatus Woesearchaeota archaeon]
MGLLDKILFWKKRDEFDFEDMANKQMPSSGLTMPEGLGENDPFKEKSMFPENKSPFEPHEEESLGARSAMPPSGMQRQSYPGIQQQSGQQGYGQNRDLELINSKLDTLKAMLTTIEQRMAEMERASGIEQKKKQERLW